MLPRRYRLDHHAVGTVFERGRSYHSGHLTVRTATANDIPAGVAVIVPKRIAKLAVRRHRIRRRIFGAVEQLLPRGPRQAGVAIIAKDGIQECSADDITAALKHAFDTAGIEAA